MSLRHVAPITQRRDATAIRPVPWYLRETAEGDYEPTTSRADATHELEHDGAGSVTRAPLGATELPVTMAKIGTAYLGMGA